MLGEIQDQINTLYQNDLPVRVIDDTVSMAEACGLSVKKAAAFAVTGAFTTGHIEVEHLTPLSYKTLVKSLGTMRNAARNHQPENRELTAAYDRAIADLHTCCAVKNNPLRAFKHVWGIQ